MVSPEFLRAQRDSSPAGRAAYQQGRAMTDAGKASAPADNGARSPKLLDLLYRHQRTGRLMGDSGFVEKLEQALGRVLPPQKPGPRKKI